MPNDGDDSVGYKKPPKSKQFQKGKSGNPAGRPKGRKSMRAMFFEQMHGLQEVVENGELKLVPRAEAAFMYLYQYAMKGDLKMLTVYLDWCDKAETSYQNSFDTLYGMVNDPLLPAFADERRGAPEPPRPFNLAEEVKSAILREGLTLDDMIQQMENVNRESQIYLKRMKNSKEEDARAGKDTKKKAPL